MTANHHIMYNTIIIGAGPAGLAMAACLAKKNRSYLVIEKTDTIAPKWHNHYKRLYLHTAKEFSSLPYFSFPKEYPRYPSRQQVVRYLEDYAHHFGIHPQFNSNVINVEKQTVGWATTIEHGDQTIVYNSKNVVVATGSNDLPYSPTWKGFDTFAGEVTHSADYQDGQALKGKTVMVVGFGNSGAEIGLDLWEYGAKPIMCVRSPVNILPKEILGVPTLAMGIVNQHLPPKITDAITQRVSKIVMGDLSKYGLKQLNRGPMQEIKHNGRVPMLDLGTVDLIKKGKIIVYPAIESFDGNTVNFVDGRSQSIDAVVLATGYRSSLNQFIDGSNVTNGRPQRSGYEAETKGLYFIGFYVSPAGMLREIATEAKRLAELIY